MFVPKDEELNRLIAKFGAIREGNPEIYDEIAGLVFNEHIEWEDNPDSYDFPFKAIVKSKPWKLRINDFPDEPMYTLFIEDEAIITFDDRPDGWVIKVDG